MEVPRQTALAETTGLRKTMMMENYLNTGSGSLSQLRESLGSLHRSTTYGVTQEVKVYVKSPHQLQSLAVIANCVIESTFREASYMFINTTNLQKFNPQLYKASSQAFVFISGTGLDQMIEYYQMEYDPNELREKFFMMFKVKT